MFYAVEKMKTTMNDAYQVKSMAHPHSACTE